MPLSNYEIAAKLSQGQSIHIDVIKDINGVIAHLEAIERNCAGVIRTLKREESKK